MENEKRRYPRVDCEIESSFRDLDPGTTRTISETLVKDISEGGIRFQANHFIPVHNKLLFRIQIPKSKTVEVVAQPAWIREIPALKQFDIGAKFASLSEEDQTIIRQFMAETQRIDRTGQF